MSQFVNITVAAQVLGVCVKTLKRWEASGRITAQRTPGGHRRYDVEKLKAQALAHSHNP
jgi:putative resolvase